MKNYIDWVIVFLLLLLVAEILSSCGQHHSLCSWSRHTREDKENGVRKHAGSMGALVSLCSLLWTWCDESLQFLFGFPSMTDCDLEVCTK